MNSLKDSGLTVLFEDEDIFIIDKPSGLHSVANSGSGGQSVAQLLCRHLPALAGAAEKSGDAGLVNRLDQMTSGLLLGAKNRHAWQAMRLAVHQGTIEKSYLALVEGNLQGEIRLDNFIGSPHRRGRKVRVYEKEPGRRERALPASTLIQPLKHLSQFDLTLVRVTAHTARRHQVRTHCAFAGHPLCGDKLYGASRDLRVLLGKENLPDFFLHADRAAFIHPMSGQKLVIDALVPEAFRDVI